MREFLSPRLIAPRVRLIDATPARAWKPGVQSSIDRLIDIASQPLSQEPARIPPSFLRDSPGLAGTLERLLNARNGFFAFESALRVFPAGRTEAGWDLESWNNLQLWRQGFGDLAEGFLFFAEDAFGSQFTLRGDAVFRFEPETGEAESMAADLEGWAARILGDYASETGYPLLHEWQIRHGALPANQRLVPVIPFVLGGEYSLDNLHALDAVEGMRLRAEIARQTRTLPEGARVQLEVVE